ncbi:MAG: hypothetical protein IKN54_08430, partial [Lachnospiraceae bacterium]|nr:hypothetical protein [Lachnospiraceae bacterium]
QPDKIDPIENITVTGDVLDITGINENRETDVDLAQFLPRGVEIYGNSTVKLRITVEGDIYKNFVISSEDLRVVNIPIDCTASVTSQDIQFTFYGKEEYVNSIIKGELQPTVDLKGLKPGEHNVEIEITLPDNVNMNGTVFAKVKIEKKNADKEDNNLGVSESVSEADNE